MAELQSIIVSHGRHFFRYLGICNPICVKLLQIMPGVISHNLKKSSLFQTIFLASTNAAYTPDTHTNTHTTIAIAEMQCVAFFLKSTVTLYAENVYLNTFISVCYCMHFHSDMCMCVHMRVHVYMHGRCADSAKFIIINIHVIMILISLYNQSLTLLHTCPCFLRYTVYICVGNSGQLEV